MSAHGQHDAAKVDQGTKLFEMAYYAVTRRRLPDRLFRPGIGEGERVPAHRGQLLDVPPQHADLPAYQP